MRVSEVAGFAFEAVRPIRPQHLIDIHNTAVIRRTSGGKIAQEYGGYTAEQFDEAREREGGILPVVIPCQNEEEDLPGTLLSIARSGDGLLPVVVNNNSRDKTAQVAQDMGALVLEQPTGRKMAAIQAGFQMARHVLKAQTILFTDGDTLVLPGWGGVMERAAAQTDEGRGVAVFGASLAMRGPSRAADLAASALSLMYKVMHARRGTPTITYGHNMGFRPDDAGVLEAAIMELPVDAFVWADQMSSDQRISRAVYECGAAVVGSHRLDMAVLTRNDRGLSLRNTIAAARGTVSHRDLVQASYTRQYAGLASAPHSIPDTKHVPREGVVE